MPEPASLKSEPMMRSQRREAARLAVLAWVLLAGLLPAGPGGAAEPSTPDSATPAPTASAPPGLAPEICPALLPQPRAPVTARPRPLVELPWWTARLAAIDARIEARGRRTIDLVFIGDSLTEGWESNPELWAHFFGRHAANLGLSGDRTEGVLWRLAAHRQMAGMAPAVAVVLIGTNNIRANPPEEIALGIAEVVRAIVRDSARTRIVLMALLPRGTGAADPAQAAVRAVNRLIAACGDDDRVTFVDLGPLLAAAAGGLPPVVSPDHLHLNPVGYAIWGAAVAPIVRDLMVRQQ